MPDVMSYVLARKLISFDLHLDGGKTQDNTGRRGTTTQRYTNTASVELLKSRQKYSSESVDKLWRRPWQKFAAVIAVRDGSTKYRLKWI